MLITDILALKKLRPGSALGGVRPSQLPRQKLRTMMMRKDPEVCKCVASVAPAMP